MKLDLGKIINVPGASESFDFTLDLSDLEYYGAYPAAEPVRVSGTVKNIAGVLNLHMDLETTLHCTCDRCTKEFPLAKKVSVDNVIVDHVNDEDDYDYIELDGSCVDLEEVATTAFILSLPSKTLCREDCKGLCSRCGADLNLGPCDCKPELDPRFAVLQQFIDKNK